MSNPVINYIVTNAILSYYLNSVPFNGVHHDSYDFIVVGGGTAGAIIASKLSSMTKFNVLLIERGGDAGNFYTEIPFVADGLYGTELIKELSTVKQSRACLENGGVCTITNANGLGGGSPINGLVYARGSRFDYNSWQQTYGARGWSYQDVLPFFNQMENYQNFTPNDEYFRGVDGPINTLAQTSFPRLQRTLIAALAKDGHFKFGDYNGQFPALFDYSQHAIGSGQRQSSWNRYLKPVIGRSNLDIVSFATVKKINFDANKRAISVTYRRDVSTDKDLSGVDVTVGVSKEVIISAGAIGTPKLLLLSGIGDANDLKSVGVDVVSNLASVGRSFHSQPKIILNLTAPSWTPRLAPSVDDYEEYQKFRTGLLSKGSVLINGFFTDKLVSINKFDTRIEVTIELDTENNSMDIEFYLLAPESRGSVKLASGNVDDDLIIDPNYYNNHQDLQILKRFVKSFASFMLASPILIRNNIGVRRQMSACGEISTQKIASDDNFLDCLIKFYTSAGHIASTCRMGSINDPMACVDANLKLLGGVQNVRVMDASVMPAITRGNTNAPTAMIAIKGSDILINDYSSRR